MASSRSNRRERGVVLVMLILVLVILLGIAALALDLGRLYVLRTEMQNAVDAAALAAAAELNARSDAIERARVAGKGLIASDSHFANVKELLGVDLEIKFEFFCSIGSSVEQDVADVGTKCTGGTDPDDPNKILVPTDNDDEQAHYVRVTLDPTLADNTERYGIDLFFLPVLAVLGIDTEKHVDLYASALAGRHFYACDPPPVMLCDPFEGSGGMRNNINAGQQIALKLQGGPNSQWAPGMFGYLDPDLEPGGGTGEIAQALGNESKVGCNPPLVLPETGQMAGPASDAINTRFDEYGQGQYPPFNKPNAYKDYPPSPNITSYGGYDDDPDNKDGKLIWRDEDISDVNRIGNGEWDRNDYFTTYHASDAWPGGWATMTRWEVYNWEIEHGLIPKEANSSHLSVAGATPMRRVLHVAVLSCNALSVKPNQISPILEPDGFAKIFITERAGDSPDSELFVEFMGWATERDEDYHVVVQLYE